MKRAVLAVLLLGMMVVPAAAAFAQPYVEDFEETLSVADTTVEPGDDVPVSGSGFAANSQIVITIESTPRTLDRVQADADGTFSVEVAIPIDMPAGQHTLKASGVTPDGAPQVLSTPITVAGDAVGEVERLAFTGVNAAAAVAVAVTLMVLGGGALLVTRRRTA